MAKTNLAFVLAAVTLCFIQNTIAQAIEIGNGCSTPNRFISNGINGLNINNGFNGIKGLNNGCGFGVGNPGLVNIGQAGINNIGQTAACNAATNSVAYGDVSILGELPVGGSTMVTGNVPVIGYVTFEGTVPAGGLVSVAAGCGCNGELVNYLA